MPPLSHHVSQVVRLGAEEQVGRIHARRIVATVENLHTFWDGTEVQLPRDTVCSFGSPLSHNLAVTCLLTTPSPLPADIFVKALYEQPEAQRYRFSPAMAYDELADSTLLSYQRESGSTTAGAGGHSPNRVLPIQVPSTKPDARPGRSERYPTAASAYDLLHR